MTLLSRYLIKQNLFLMFCILLIGSGLYILTDLFERLDNFLEAGIGIAGMLGFFAVKLPMIVSQIMPAVFLLALVAQMNLLERSRELVALTAGGISYGVLVRFVIFYGLFWSLAQFVFGQVLGVAGEQTAARIWSEQVRKQSSEDSTIPWLWFTDKNRVVHIVLALPTQKRGNFITVYVLDQSGIGINEIIKADKFSVLNSNTWLLENGRRLVPRDYSATPFQTLELPMKQSLRSFQIASGTSSVKPSQLTLNELSKTISRLQRSGSNVENLIAAWHGKLSYAASILVMGLLALVISRVTSSIYRAIGLTLSVVFAYYCLNTMSTTLGEKGLISPAIGAWFSTVFFLIASALWLGLPALRQHMHSMKLRMQR